MNAVLEYVNSAGKGFVEFAWPMLVQSSVLIIILLIADLVLKKKVQAVFRYWLWMLVLVKLVLPTTLSSPVSLGFLLPVEFPALQVTETRTTGDVQPVLPAKMETRVSEPMNMPAMQAPARNSEAIQIRALTVSSTVTWQGAVFMGWLAIIIVMLLLLLQRVVFVCGLVAQAKEASPLMNDTLKYCCRQMGIKGKIGLKVSANATSPAVCGLFRPVILVPENLGSSLGAEHLRTVLLHELAHIKRGDLWVNLVQTLLQMIYFYNPLLWLANAMIRRVREQAVDEAVLVAMGERAQQYPETLLNVAKLAFKRPMLSLRLIGVVESKSALSGRIKHILGRPIPKSAKLGIWGLVAVFILGAALLPMSQSWAGEPEFIVKGRVTDAVTGQPIAGAKVGDDRYAGGKQYGVTDSNGNYSYPTWGEEHGVKAEASGYKLRRKGLLTSFWQTEKEKVLDFELEPGSDLSKVPEKFVGHWQGQSKIYNSWCNQRWLPVDIVIDPNGAVSGHIGDAEVRDAYFRYKGDFYVKQLKHNTHYIIRGKLSGSIIEKENITRKQFAMGLDIADSNIVGSVGTDGFWFGGKSWGEMITSHEMLLRKIPTTKAEKDQPATSDAELASRLESLVEDFFKNNYRDITARKTIEWGEPAVDAKGNMSIRYKYEATIWDKDKIITDQLFVFDKDGKLISYDKISPFPIGSKQWLQERVEEFFKNNYRDITARKTLEWGEPQQNEDGGYSIRYKYEATIWDKDKIISDKLFTFDEKGKSVSVKDVAQAQKETGKSASPEFKVTLSNGVTVELVGVCEHPSKDKQWWRPDGTLLSEAPSDKIDVGGFQVGENEAAYEIVAELKGPAILQDRSKTPERWKVPQARKVGLGKSGQAKNRSGIPSLRATTVIVEKGVGTIDVEFGIVSTWERNLSISSNEPSEQKVKDIGIVVGPPYEKEGNAIVTIKIPNQVDRKMAVKVVATLKNGQVYDAANWSRNGKVSFVPSTDNYEFNGLSLTDIDHFEIYTSKYQWVEFRNVSLKPGTKTDVQIGAAEQISGGTGEDSQKSAGQSKEKGAGKVAEDEVGRIYDKELGLSIKIPADWDVYKNPSPGRYKFSWQLLPPKLEAWAAFIGIERDAGTKSAPQVAKADITILKDYFTDYTVRWDSWKETEIGGLPAARYAADYKDKEKAMVEYRTYLLDKSMVYWFVFRIEKNMFEANKDKFDGMVNSFKFSSKAKVINEQAGKTGEQGKNASAESAAVEAALGWLKLIDDGNYAKSWDEAAGVFKSAVSSEQWGNSVKAVCVPLGKVILREVKSKIYSRQLPGAPDGEYVVIEFDTSFENKKIAVETVTPTLDKDGAWRVSGYYIK